MAYTVVPHKSVTEFGSLHKLNSIFNGTDSDSQFPPFLCYRRTKYALLQPETYGAGATPSLLRCKGQQQLGVCIDKSGEGSEQEVRLNGNNMVIEKKFKAKIHPSKYLYSLKFSSNGSYIENDEKTNNEILQSLCTRGKLNEAVKVINVMTCRNQIPHSPSCINIIRGLVNAKQTDRAYNLLQLVVMTGVFLDIITYNMVIGGLCRKRHLESAIEVLELMNLSSCPPDTITFNTVIRALCDQGKLDEAIQFWKDQLRKGCTPYVISYTILIELVCKSLGASRALEIMEDIAVEGCYPDMVTYNSIINLTCKQGNYEEAILVVCSLVSRGMEPNTVTYNIIINGLCKEDRVDGAIDFLHQMVLQGCSPDIITYTTLLHALCKEAMVDEVIEILQRLKNTNCSPTLITYNTVVDGLAKQGAMEKAMEVYKYMVEHGPKPDDVIYRCLIWGFCRADMVEEAVALLNVIGQYSRRTVRDNCYRFIVHRLCQKKKVDTAVEVVEMLISSRTRCDPILCSTIVVGVHAAGMIDEAAELRKKLIERELLPVKQ